MDILILKTVSSLSEGSQCKHGYFVTPVFYNQYFVMSSVRDINFVAAERQ